MTAWFMLCRWVVSWRSLANDEVWAGMSAGLAASAPQVLLTRAMQGVLGLRGEPADVGPRFVRRVAERVDHRPSATGQWWLAAVFHFGYAAGWGVLYGAVQRRLHLRPAAGGGLLAATLYVLAFSRVGVATRLGSEPDPSRRDTRRWMVLVTAPVTFGALTAWFYSWLRGHGEDDQQPASQEVRSEKLGAHRYRFAQPELRGAPRAVP